MIHNPTTFVLTGLPRGGTTYLSAVLYNPPQVITISDPQGVFRRFHLEHGVSAAILELFEDFRRRIERGESIPTLEGTDGFVGRGRVDTWNQKKVLRPVEAAPGFALGMKNPEIFLAHLGVFLAAGLRCVVSLRHPLSILHSWRRRTLDRAAQDGGPPRGFGAGEAPGFVAPHADPLTAAIALHNHYCHEILSHRGHAGLLLIRHEDWFADPTQLDRVCAFLSIPSLGHLRPPPMPATAWSLGDAERAAILRGCAIAGEFGYPLQDGALLPPPAVTGS